MICPMCQHIFRGNKFYKTGATGTFRICPSCEAEFKEPTLPKKKLKWDSYEDWDANNTEWDCSMDSTNQETFRAIWDAARELE
jgi:transcription elongation factor Elf1